MPTESHGIAPARPTATGQRRPAQLTVSPMPGGLGASCTGIDLSQKIAARDRVALLDAFRTHHVLVIRDQHLDKARLADFAGIFGEVEGNIFRKTDGSLLEAVHEITNFGADGRPSADPYLKSNFNWHTDKAYQAVPSLLTMLLALELPPSGGDTQFADMTAAYDALSEATKAEIAGLKVVHSFEHMRVSTGDRPLTAAEREATPPVTHPLVRTHPDTGASASTSACTARTSRAWTRRRAARCSTGCSLTRPSRASSTRTNGGRTISCCGTIAAWSTARSPITSSSAIGACSCASS